MKLLKLTLKNFKGIRDFTLEANGKNVNCYGDNATGKTTIFDAFLWLLFDKDSKNRKDFELKTLDENNNPSTISITRSKESLKLMKNKSHSKKSLPRNGRKKEGVPQKNLPDIPLIILSMEYR